MRTASNGANRKQQKKAEVAALATIKGISSEDIVVGILTSATDDCAIMTVVINDE